MKQYSHSKYVVLLVYIHFLLNHTTARKLCDGHHKTKGNYCSSSSLPASILEHGALRPGVDPEWLLNIQLSSL